MAGGHVRLVNGRAIQELAAHMDLSMTQGYMHLSPAALDGAIRLLEQPAGTTPSTAPYKVLETVWRRALERKNDQ